MKEVKEGRLLFVIFKKTFEWPKEPNGETTEPGKNQPAKVWNTESKLIKLLLHNSKTYDRGNIYDYLFNDLY